MSLAERLDRIREGFARQAPEEVLALMHRVTDDLRASGIAERAVGEGQRAPSFALADSHGNEVRLEDLLRGPLVLTFFRGHW